MNEQQRPGQGEKGCNPSAGSIRGRRPGVKPGERNPLMDQLGGAEIPLVSKDEAIAEVRRWLEVEKVDPEGIFTAMGDQVVRYKDLVAHLERESPDGQLLRFAISRGRLMASERRRTQQALLQIVSGPTGPSGSGTLPAPADPEEPTEPA
jgi:hypothetical protein